jgi:DNA-binding transcriptional MerR regulator
MSEISKQRLKDNKEVKKIQEETTAVLQKRIELEERLKTLKPNRKAWRDTKAEIENVNKEVQNYLAKMGSLGTAGARQLKAYEKAGLITNADKTQWLF